MPIIKGVQAFKPITILTKFFTAWQWDLSPLGTSVNVHKIFHILQQAKWAGIFPFLSTWYRKFTATSLQDLIWSTTPEVQGGRHQRQKIFPWRECQVSIWKQHSLEDLWHWASSHRWGNRTLQILCWVDRGQSHPGETGPSAAARPVCIQLPKCPLPCYKAWLRTVAPVLDTTS